MGVEWLDKIKRRLIVLIASLVIIGISFGIILWIRKLQKDVELTSNIKR